MIPSLLLLFICGASLASFLFCSIQHLHYNQYNTHSQCDHCHHTLYWFDLIPVISFFLQKGRCRYCNQPIVHHYIIIELCFGLMFPYLFYSYGINTLSMQQFSIILLFFTLSISDLIYYEIYLTLFIPLSSLCIIYYYLTQTPLYIKQAFIIMGVCLLLTSFITSYIGSGDIIFFIFISLLFPYSFLLKIIWLASVIGLIHLLYTKQHALPYIPYIVLSIFLLFTFSS